MNPSEMERYLDEYTELALQAAYCREANGTTPDARKLVRGMFEAVWRDGKADGLSKPKRP